MGSALAASAQVKTAQRGRIDTGNDSLDVRLDDMNFDSLARYADGAWTYARNWRPRGGRLEKVGGFRYIGESVSTPPSMRVRDSVYTGRYSLPHLVNCGRSNGPNQTIVTVSNGVTHTDLTGQVTWPTAADEFGYSSCTLNGVIVIHSADGVPYYFTPGSTLTACPDWPVLERARVMRSHRSHLFALALGTDGSPDAFGSSVRWSDAADPGTIPQSWTPGPTTEAGQRELSGAPGDIQDGLTLRDAFIIYKTGACFVLNYTGGRFIYSSRILFDSVGALGKNCIATIRGHHIVVSDGDIVRHDGNTADSIVDGRVRKWFFNQVDDLNRQYLSAKYYPDLNEVWIGVPDANTADMHLAMIYDLARNRWGVRDFGEPETHPTIFVAGSLLESTTPQDWTDPGPWADDPDTWAAGERTFGGNMLGFQQGGRYMGFDLETTINSGGATLQRQGLDLGYPEQDKTVVAIYPRADAPQATPIVKARVGFQSRDGGPVTWGSEFPQDLSETEGKLDQFVTGKLIAVELSVDADTNPGLTIDGFGIEFHVAGT